MSLFTPTGHLLQLSQFQLRLDEGADPNEIIHGTERNYGVPLIAAIAFKTSHYLHALLTDSRTDLAITDLQGRTALHVAAERGKVEAIRLLCEAGAPLEARDVDGGTPLHYAMHALALPSTQVMGLLMDYGANVDSQNSAGRTTLHEVMLSGSSFWHKPVDEKAGFLLRARCALDVQDEEGRTALFLAAISGHYRIVRALLACGANPELADHDGCRPVDGVRRQIAEDSPGLDYPEMGYLESLDQALNALVLHTRSRLTELSMSMVARSGGSVVHVQRM